MVIAYAWDGNDLVVDGLWNNQLVSVAWLGMTGDSAYLELCDRVSGDRVEGDENDQFLGSSGIA